MSRALVLALQIGVLVSAVAAILSSIRIILQQTVGGSWFCGCAMAAFAAPAFFAVALFLVRRSEAVK